MTTFLLVRHGQSTANVDGSSAMAGWTDLPLTERGEREARELALRLLREPTPLAIVSSPLERALRTARLIAERLPGVAIELEPGLREIGCGEVDGWPTSQVEQRYPAEWAKNLAQADADFRWPGGESYREFRERVLGAMGLLAGRYPAGSVLVVTHAGVISQLIGWMRCESPARWEAHRPGNTSVTELRWGPGGARLVRFDAQ